MPKKTTLPGFEPGIFWSVVRRVIHCATRPLTELIHSLRWFMLWNSLSYSSSNGLPPLNVSKQNHWNKIRHRRGSNPWSSVYETDALPLGHCARCQGFSFVSHFFTAWKHIFNKSRKKIGSGGIRTHASEETGALNQRLRPLGHATHTYGLWHNESTINRPELGWAFPW